MATFLLVDDDARDIAVMTKILGKFFPTHRIVTADDGPAGLEAARTQGADVIFLDVAMPGPDGFQICRALKIDNRTAHIPVVIVTGVRTAPGSRVEGMELGADGYLFKPFEVEDFVGQAKVMLRIKETEDRLRAQKSSLEKAFAEQTVELERHREALQKKVHELEQTVQDQTQKLIHADRLASAGVLAAGLAHEINNPNTFISSNLATFARFWASIEKALDGSPNGSAARRRQIAFIRREMPGLVDGLREGTERIARIIQGMKSYTSLKPEGRRQVDIAQTVETALRLVAARLRGSITVHKRFAPGLRKVHGSEQLLCQVFVNLFMNAADAINEAGPAGALTIRAAMDRENNVAVSVHDTGAGIAPENVEKLFDPFFTTRRDQGGSGLGLFVCHGIVKGHNGSLEVKSQRAKGATFTVRLPAANGGG